MPETGLHTRVAGAGQHGHRGWHHLGAAALPLTFGVLPAQAAGWQELALSGGSLWPLLAGGLALAATHGFWRARRERTRRANLEAELAETRGELDRAELLLFAEPQVMLLLPAGKGDGESPAQRFVHPQLARAWGLEETAPERFEDWLEEESARHLRRHLQRLREDGAPFNISVRTRGGELAEADGRVAGRQLALRFRPLFGERLQALEQTHDIRQLKDHARRITQLLAKAPEPVWITDDDGRLQWANEAWLARTGAASLEAARAEGLQLVGREELAAATVLPEEQGWQRYLASTVLGGERRHFEIWQRSFEAGLVHWAREVSECERVREELQRYRSAQSRIFDQLNTAIAIFDAEQRLIFHNAAYARLWGFDEAWLARRPTEAEILNRLFDQQILRITEDFPTWRQRWLEIYGDGQPRRQRWKLANGHMVEVIAEPQPGEGVIYLFEDITEQLRLEARYREALQVQEETLDNLHEAVAVFGTDGRLRLFNRVFADLWEMDEARLKMRPHVDDIIRECRHLVDDPHWWDDFKFSVIGVDGERKPYSRRITLRDGLVFDCLVVPLPDGNTLITWTDMTDAVRAARAAQERAEALEESDRIKTVFLDSISYELRSPLNTIKGYAEAMRMGLGGQLNERQQEFMDNILEASFDLLDKIDTVLDLTAIDAGKLELRVETFEVVPMLEELAEQVESRLARRDMALEVEVAEDVRTMRGDRQRIMQILRHLLVNAIGFGRRGSTVRLGARHNGQGEVEFWVADEGPGMNAESLARAFERFYARPSPEGHRGPGLGLPLVKALVELHGGQVELFSREGRGTTVICRLPQQRAAVREEA